MIPYVVCGTFALTGLCKTISNVFACAKARPATAAYVSPWGTDRATLYLLDISCPLSRGRENSINRVLGTGGGSGIH